MAIRAQRDEPVKALHVTPVHVFEDPQFVAVGTPLLPAVGAGPGAADLADVASRRADGDSQDIPFVAGEHPAQVRPPRGGRQQVAAQPTRAKLIGTRHAAGSRRDGQARRLDRAEGEQLADPSVGIKPPLNDEPGEPGDEAGITSEPGGQQREPAQLRIPVDAVIGDLA